MDDNYTNPVKHKLKTGQKTCGAFLQINCNISAEILSQAGFDWLIIDMEHSPVDPSSLISQIQAIECASEAVTFVRAPGNNELFIKRILDTGPAGILIPYINNKEEAERAVSACLFPPLGMRGAALSPRAARFGSVNGDYFAATNKNLIVMVSIESQQAVDNLDDILQVEGIDGIFIGPMDLAVSLGCCDPSHAEVQESIRHIETKVLASDKFLGTISTNWDKAKNNYNKGYQWLILMQDGLTLANTADRTIATFIQEFGNK